MSVLILARDFDPSVDRMIPVLTRRGVTVHRVNTGWFDEDGTRKNVYTRLMDEADFADLAGVEHTTHLFQRWVPKARECRVIVIGQHITAAAITAGSKRAYVDYRTDYDSLSYDLVEPPDSVATGVRALLESFGLVYGALDFVITPEGKWVFLESTRPASTDTLSSTPARR